MRAVVGLAIGAVVAAALVAMPRGEIRPELPASLAPLEEAVGREPSVANLVRLSAALVRHAQHTGDDAWHVRAEEVARRAVDADPADSNALALLGWSLAGQHRFAEAARAARDAIAANPEDPLPYGVLTDASVQLGQYEQAIAAAQRMLRLKPSAAAYARAAHLRALHGDQRGGIELMRLALEATPPTATDERVWLLAHLGADQLAAGDEAGAARSFHRALALAPADGRSLLGLAAIHAARGEGDEAIALYRRVLGLGPDPDAHVALADLLVSLGREPEAAPHYAAAERLEKEELLGPGVPELRHLALFYAERGTEPERALEMAQLEAERRDDVDSADTLAWVLYRCGRIAAARGLSRRALRLGSRDPLLLYHAGIIAAAAGEQAEAAHLLDQALARRAALGPLRVREATATRARLGETHRPAAEPRPGETNRDRLAPSDRLHPSDRSDRSSPICSDAPGGALFNSASQSC